MGGGLEKKKTEMAKAGGLSDDSALITAFDEAMSKYKKMHKKKDTEGFEEGEDDVISSAKGDASTAVDESNGVVRMLGESHSNTKTADIGEQPVQDYQGTTNGSLNLQGIEEYNRLLGEYYELDEKRLKIWEQLQQLGNCSYQDSWETANLGAQGEMHSAPEEYPTRACQACHQSVGCSTCMFVCPNPASQCPAYSGCYTCFDPNVTGKPPSIVNDDIVKTGMGAAEKAISSLRIDSSTNLNVDGENLKAKENKQETPSRPSSKTDFSVILNAWYSAGFYTGKYLTEQSLLKKTSD